MAQRVRTVVVVYRRVDVIWLAVCLVASSLVASLPPQDRVLVYSLTEEVPPETFIANLLIDSRLAVKYSTGILSTLSFVFLKEVEHLELFSLDRLSGILRTARSVDRDAICPGQLNCVLRLDLAVQPPAYFEVIKVELVILDINDNGPTFDSSRFPVVVPESAARGERFPLPTASDIDSVPNGVVEYRLLTATVKFRLEVKHDPTSAGRPLKEVWLVLLTELDREEEERLELLMAAYDGGIPRRSAVIGVEVQVGDVNDNGPRFERSAYNVSVVESTPIGATIARLFASDADSGENGHVRYRFSQRSDSNYGDLFAVDPESGDVVLLQMLDHAAAGVYSLGVIAEDQGQFSSPALAALVVTVVDINDHGPQIAVDVLGAGGSVEVSENTAAGTFVAHVSTLDKDSGENGLVRCSIGHNNNQNFRLIPIYDGEYKLVTASVFDREAVGRFEVVIRCHDMGEPRLHVNKVVTVNVADVNDNRPVFTQDVYNASIEENLAWGSFIVRVSAHDPDSGPNGEILYLLDSDADQRFHVDPDTGVVTTLAGLDREASERIEFHVLATNKGEHARMLSRALVRVHVTDVDDEVPRFLSDRYAFDVYENQPPKTEVGQVMAVDRDLPPFNGFLFQLVAATDDDADDAATRAFGVDPRFGIVFARQPLDREARSRYEVTVEVVSNTVVVKRDVTRVTIDVIDTNDNAPNLTFPSGDAADSTTVVSVPANLRDFEVVCSVAGHDLDAGVNAELTFDLVAGNGTDLFSVDPLTGHVTLLGTLRGSVNETFALVVRARDGGTPAQYSTGTLYVTVVEGNQSPLSSGTAPRAENQWTSSWLANVRLLLTAAIVAVCFVLVAILVSAILFVRRRNRQRRHRSKTRLTTTTTTTTTTTSRNETRDDDDDDDDDDGDSLNRMKMMMTDGKMVRMKNISYSELNVDASCNTGSQLSTGSGRTGGRGGAAGIPVRLHHLTAVAPQAMNFDPETDSGCADVSHCNDDVSSGSEKSNKEAVETGSRDRISSDRRLLWSTTASRDDSRIRRNSPSHVIAPSHVTAVVVSGCHAVRNDSRLISAAPVAPFRSSSSPPPPPSPPTPPPPPPPPVVSFSSNSLPSSSSLLSANRKSVRFADSGEEDAEDDTGSTANRPQDGDKNQNGGGDWTPFCSSSDRQRERNVPEGGGGGGGGGGGRKILTYAHLYPTHVGMATFLPDDGSFI